MAQKFFPVYVVPLEEGLPREGWYVATKLDGGYDIVRYGYGYISDLDIGVLYNVYVPSDLH